MDDGAQTVPPLPWKQRYPKCNDSSERCRLFANTCLKKKDFKNALDYYNASLCYAPAGSSDIPLIYSNRSAAFSIMGKYALAIENIELARESGYPAGKLAQLDEREEKCERMMEKIAFDMNLDKNFDAFSFFKLSHPPNEKIPFIAGCLELHENEKFGRHIVTNKDLKTGDIIAIEDPVFA